MQIDLGECLQLSVLTLNINTFVTSVGLVEFIMCKTVVLLVDARGCSPEAVYFIVFYFCDGVRPLKAPSRSLQNYRSSVVTPSAVHSH